MKASPVQMLQLFFKKVDLEFDPQHAPQDVPNPLTNVFTFDGVTLSTEVSLSEADPTHVRGQLFVVSLRLMVQNQANEEGGTQAFSPYKIDVSAEALILIPNGAKKLDLPENLATVNGASLIWSAIREQVLNITSRMQAGPVMLPTVHFHDLKKNVAGLDGPPADEAEEPAPPVKARKARK